MSAARTEALNIAQVCNTRQMACATALFVWTRCNLTLFTLIIESQCGAVVTIAAIIITLIATCTSLGLHV